jgi:DNA polymerase III delta subunit
MSNGVKIRVVCGDPFYRQKDKSQLMSSVDPGTRVVELNCPSADELAKELLIQPLFSSNKFIWVSNLDSDKEVEALFEKLGKLNIIDAPWQLVIEEDDIRKGKGYAGRLSKILPEGMVELRSHSRCSKPTEGYDFVLEEMIPSSGVKIDKEAAKLLVELCGCDYSMIAGEVQKLAILSDGRILGVNDITSVISQMGETENFLNLYVTIMCGDSSAAVGHARSIIEATGPESVFACIMKLVEAAVIVSHIGDKDKGLDFAKRKRPTMQRVTLNRFLWSGSSKEDGGKPPTPFLYKVADKVSNRLGGQK